MRVGTGDEVERIIQQARPSADVMVVSNPEFLREGAAIQDFEHPDRIVIDSSDAHAREAMAELYRPLFLNAPPTGPLPAGVTEWGRFRTVRRRVQSKHGRG